MIDLFLNPVCLAQTGIMLFLLLILCLPFFNKNLKALFMEGAAIVTNAPPKFKEQDATVNVLGKVSFNLSLNKFF